MANDGMPGPCKAAPGIAQIVILGELAVNQALDHVETESLSVLATVDSGYIERAATP